jgi:dihydroorotase-like cyclic amidohydrolase
MKLVTDATILTAGARVRSLARHRGGGPDDRAIAREGRDSLTRRGGDTAARLTVLPGMIDSHVHLMGMQRMDTRLTRSSARVAGGAVRPAARAYRGGDHYRAGLRRLYRPRAEAGRR